MKTVFFKKKIRTIGKPGFVLTLKVWFSALNQTNWKVVDGAVKIHKSWHSITIGDLKPQIHSHFQQRGKNANRASTYVLHSLALGTPAEFKHIPYIWEMLGRKASVHNKGFPDTEKAFSLVLNKEDSDEAF